MGLDALRGLLDDSVAGPSAGSPATGRPAEPALPPLSGLIDELATSQHALVMVMGKGGVGKTTVAAAIAVELAKRASWST